MITWAVIRLFLGGMVKGIGEFIYANWRRLVPVLGALFLWWYISNLQGQRDAAVKTLATHIQQDKAAAEKRVEENRRKESQVVTAFNQVISNHATEIDQIKRDYDAKHQTDKTASDRTVAGWRERVRLELERQTAAGLSGIPETSEGITGGRKDCDAAAARRYDVLETSCKVTTSDYNALHDSWDNACAVYGCK